MDKGMREILIAALIFGAAGLGAYVGDTIATRRMEAALGVQYGPEMMDRWAAGGACLMLQADLLRLSDELRDDYYTTMDRMRHGEVSE